MKTGWWYRATREQKLAQIDAGIELGMTARQVAFNCGYTIDTANIIILNFARRHGRIFQWTEDKQKQVNRKATVGTRRRAAAAAARKAYFAGEPTNIWEVE